jgi:hypothetical protein
VISITTSQVSNRQKMKVQDILEQFKDEMAVKVWIAWGKYAF